MENKETVLQTKIKAFLSENKVLLEKHGLVETMGIDFPKYRAPWPIEVQLALQVIQSHGGIFVTKYDEKK